mgnify:CR=1 FL=1
MLRLQITSEAYDPRQGVDVADYVSLLPLGVGVDGGAAWASRLIVGGVLYGFGFQAIAAHVRLDLPLGQLEILKPVHLAISFELQQQDTWGEVVDAQARAGLASLDVLERDVKEALRESARRLLAPYAYWLRREYGLPEVPVPTVSETLDLVLQGRRPEIPEFAPAHFDGRDLQPGGRFLLGVRSGHVGAIYIEVGEHDASGCLQPRLTDTLRRAIEAAADVAGWLYRYQSIRFARLRLLSGTPGARRRGGRPGNTEAVLADTVRVVLDVRRRNPGWTEQAVRQVAGDALGLSEGGVRARIEQAYALAGMTWRRGAQLDPEALAEVLRRLDRQARFAEN